MRALVPMKVKPNSHMRLRSVMPRRRLIRKRRTHMAQGLKPSRRPRTTVSRGKERRLGLIVPKMGRWRTDGKVVD